MTERFGGMDWKRRAKELADRVTDPDSRWRDAVAGVARHELVPRWWEVDGSGGWVVREGASDPYAWAKAAYGERSLVIRIGTLHADHAKPDDRTDDRPGDRPDDRPHGLPASSAAPPHLTVRMLRHARLGAGLPLLDLGTATGELAAYASHRLGGTTTVTSVDTDPHLTDTAGIRLARMGLHPQLITENTTEHIPGLYERIVSTAGLSAGLALRPALAALVPGGRIAAPLARTCLIITGWKHANGDVIGQVEHDTAPSVPARTGDDHPYAPVLTELFAHARDARGDETGTGRHPVVDLANARELRSMLEVTAPGVEYTYATHDRHRTACLLHPDGSWARATAERTGPPEVHQGGPQRLWTILERIRDRLSAEGSLPLLGARVHITPDGNCHLSRGNWHTTIGSGSGTR
ncbi:methyltransferase type 11 [Streptomyces sp. AM 4-1-1]|uniref:methyltransferase type 11 n=1 Tax=Streptomyces sp. AM 4-1-1 TaxID=3028710 RepID=UPI0023B8FA24|nr:methyltransferase type 11 [Streptomyces sp. AM 4-1-1]WEH34034.1 methyltransferase type 11 [Streptomyces sp. AM 4-1-1]